MPSLRPQRRQVQRFLALSFVLLLARLQFTSLSKSTQTIFFNSLKVSLYDNASLGSLNATPETGEIRLAVPFYVYENETLNWYNSSWKLKGYESHKHSDDWHLLQAALRHPLRTQDPSEARLFFVPTLLNAAAILMAEKSTLCVGINNEKCFTKGGVYSYVDRALGEQEWFQRSQGKDHIIVAAQYRIGQYFGVYRKTKSLQTPDRFPNLRNCNVINHEGRRPLPYPERFALPSAKIGTPCPTKPKAFDFGFIGSLYPENINFQARRDICQWLSQSPLNSSQILDANGFSVSICGEGGQCPALAKSKYGFHVRGDSLGSNRVMDTFLSRTVPLFTDIAQYDVLPPLVPWRNLTYLVSVDDAEAFYSSVGSVLSRPPSEYERLLEEIDRYMPIFDHTTIYRFDAYMAEFAKMLGLQ